MRTLPRSVLILSLCLLVMQYCCKVAAQEVSVITIQAPLPTNEVTYVDDSEFRSAVLNSTNFFRQQHGAEPLSWNDSLTSFAEAHDDNCIFEHSGGPHGENIAYGYDNITAAIDAWGDERDIYSFEDQGFSEETGHFTQLVWQSTASIGCGRRWCDDSFTGWYLVCEYDPRGNIIGQFDREVSPQVAEDDGNDVSDDFGTDDGTHDQDELCDNEVYCHSSASLGTDSIFTSGPKILVFVVAWWIWHS